MYELIWKKPLDNSTFLFFAQEYIEKAQGALLYSGQTKKNVKTLEDSSYLALFPFDEVKITLQESQQLSLNPWALLQKKLTFPVVDNSVQPLPLWLGFLTYELGAFSDEEIVLPYTLHPFLPLSYFARYAVLLKYDHKSQKVSLYIDSEALLDHSQKEVLNYFINFNENEDNISFCKKNQVVSTYDEKEFIRSFAQETFESYSKKIAALIELIKAGEVYQINLSQNFIFPPIPKAAHFNFFMRLIEENPAPYCSLFFTPWGTIICSSPELFLQKKESFLLSRPIKGTISRGKTAREDIEQKQKLLASEKDHAELLMITDLMRNDLGRLALLGSVQVPELFVCEKYSNVFHLVSTIHANVSLEISALTILRACFPGGSISGCPKLSAIKAINSQEKRPRGIYTGSIGYICNNQDFTFNIAIRTLFASLESVELQLGGAIVTDSLLKEEYEETLVKGKTLFASLYQFLSER